MVRSYGWDRVSVFDQEWRRLLQERKSQSPPYPIVRDFTSQAFDDIR